MTNEDKQVTIILDGKPTKTDAGSYTLAQFKEKLGIDANKVVEIFVKGKFEPASEPIVVKGGEKFATHVPRGGSSWK